MSNDSAGESKKNDLKKAGTVFWYGAGFFLVIIVLYAGLHHYRRAPSYEKENADLFFEKMGRVKAVIAKPQVLTADLFNALDDLAGVKNDELVAEVSKRIHFIKGVAGTLKGEASGKFKVSQDDKRIVEIRNNMDFIEKEATWLVENDGFFWGTGFWKWLEIVFWGEFGVLTGILVWVCTQVKKDKYDEERYLKEKYWYRTEVVIGPVVVVAVFFLLKQFMGTILVGMTEEQVRGSIYTTLGVSFALGFSLRRTLGVFSVIKGKLPLPGNENADDSGQQKRNSG